MRIFERASAVELIGSRKGALFHLVEDDLHVDKLAFGHVDIDVGTKELFCQQRDIETVGVESGQVASFNVAVPLVTGLPDFTRLGVFAIAAAVRLVMALPGGWGLARRLVALPLPLVGEYPRLVRSLAWAYVWEHWPSTGPTGGTS